MRSTSWKCGCGKTVERRVYKAVGHSCRRGQDEERYIAWLERQLEGAEACVHKMAEHLRHAYGAIGNVAGRGAMWRNKLISTEATR